MPDDELLQLAEQGTLKEPDVLTAQVKRMLADPRSGRFSQNFVEQWLGLDGMNSVTHVTDSSCEKRCGKSRSPFLRSPEAQQQHHGLHAFRLRRGQRATGAHYGIPRVYGPHFRKVPIAPQTNRGGLLTVPAILTMNSDGTDSHPLKRGVWMLERILQDPPPPPPPMFRKSI